MVQVQQHILRLALLLPLCVVAQRPTPGKSSIPTIRSCASRRRSMSVSQLSRQINDYYDFFQNTFFTPDKKEIRHHTAGPSLAVNTLGEVPDSAWFTNRIGSRPMTDRGTGARARRFPCARPRISRGPSSRERTRALRPGLVIRDSEGRKYFLKFDPKSNPEMASAADVLGCKFFYDLGYNTPENYIVRFARSQTGGERKIDLSDAAGHEARHDGPRY